MDKLPVAAAASEPSSLISMKIFCNAWLTFRGVLERRIKSALSSNMVFKPIYEYKFVKFIFPIYLSCSKCILLIDYLT